MKKKKKSGGNRSMYFLIESPQIMQIPKIIKKNPDRIRMECCLQTLGVLNRNKRRYREKDFKEALEGIKDRIQEGGFVGELDHPTKFDDMKRQLTVLYSRSSHRILEIGIDGNKVIGVVETLRTPMGKILKNLSEDGIPVGFSFRGAGEVNRVTESGNFYFEVTAPLHIVTWDSVSYPSHKEAKIVRISENTFDNVRESLAPLCESTEIQEREGMICTSEGICYLPNDFDRLVKKRIIQLKNKFKI